MWKQARNQNPVEYPADQHGWRKTMGQKIDIVWFEGLQYPETLGDLLANEPLEDDSDDEGSENIIYSISSDEEDTVSIN